jgi:hypothetical protein
MGQAKALMMEHQENIEWAKGVLAETGAITECEYHESYTDDGDPEAVEEAIKLARKKPPRGLTPDEAAELVRQAILDVGDECPGCVAWDRD